MARGAAAVLFLAVVALVVCALLRDRPVPPGAAPQTVLARFRTEHEAMREVELRTLYAGREELLDPKLVLPSWHRHPRAEAAAVANAIKSCPLATLEVHDPALLKAYEFAKARCARESVEELLAITPLMHPSGKSYAALAGRADENGLHMLERTTLGLTARDLVAIGRGDSLVLSTNALVVVETSEREQRLFFYDRDDWERETRSAAVGLETRAPGGFCSAPASPSLCWTRMDPRRPWVEKATMGSVVVAALAGLLLGFAFVQERRRAAADRLHVFRTLTHELRTPAQSLGLDIELLQSSYDDLPADAQESVLRVSEGVARLNRVIHRSARYLQLFDGKGAIVKRERVSSVRELMEEMSGEWPEGVELRSADDASIMTDPEWLSVAVRNLVENGCKHGKPPVVVAWKVTQETLEITVSDAGTSPRHLLRQAAYHREETKGLGLGLSIVQRIAERLGGKLTHQSSPTTWTLRL